MAYAKPDPSYHDLFRLRDYRTVSPIAKQRTSIQVNKKSIKQSEIKYHKNKVGKLKISRIKQQ